MQAVWKFVAWPGSTGFLFMLRQMAVPNMNQLHEILWHYCWAQGGQMIRLTALTTTAHFGLREVKVKMYLKVLSAWCWLFHSSFRVSIHVPTQLLAFTSDVARVLNFSTYRKVFNVRGTLVGNKTVDHTNVVGASPVGAAPTTSSFSTQHLASIYSAKTTASPDEKHLSLWIWCVLY